MLTRRSWQLKRRCKKTVSFKQTMVLKGIGSSNGIAVGNALVLSEQKLKITASPADSQTEITRFRQAVKQIVNQISVLEKQSRAQSDTSQADILEAHRSIAQDPSLLGEVETLIKDKKTNALWALDQVSSKWVTLFANMEDAYMRERASDIKDVANQIAFALAGVKRVDLSQIKKPVVIVAHDITPSQSAQMNDQVLAFATEIGGQTSHAAIIARARQIPAVLGVSNLLKKIKTGDPVAIDGETGMVIVKPTLEEKKRLQTKMIAAEVQRASAEKFRGKKTCTLDSHQVELAANISSLEDLEKVLTNDAEGIGLFRSEFIYMHSQHWPSEEEQYKIYRQILKKMAPRPVVVRTLDIGGDKTLAYHKFPVEDNPFLGNRAVRFSLDKPDIFRTQLRALIRASIHGNLAIMFPMIATLEEFLAAKKIYQSVYNSLVKAGTKVAKRIQVGMMVEIPAAAVLSEQFARHADFLSIGTNDLIQYSMAHDRMNQKVATFTNRSTPSILHLIRATIEGGHKHNKWVGMCGEMAGDKGQFRF
ncbi:phosphoenolpyruvate--protein phosphotransferase [Mycoplasma sp. ATU-Cv-508]|uniref:phosphoenolpyruvate--protein phosphotransferase n=1 Tax=Mycoplasma sp. ATU-Cv-508 TaxID=2048001 RepID=UPI0031F2E92B